MRGAACLDARLFPFCFNTEAQGHRALRSSPVSLCLCVEIGATACSRRSVTSCLRAVRAFAFAPNPVGEHPPFRVITRLPPTWPVVCVGSATVRMQRLQQKSALLGVPGDDQPRKQLKCAFRFLVRPVAVRLRHGCEADDAARVAVAAANVTLARRGENGLNTGPEELEIERWL